MKPQRNLSPTDLADLVAVFDTGSMGQAAELNGKSKPAVSITITRLERLLGIAILVRPSWKVQFTREGEALVAKARSVLAEVDSLYNLAGVLATGIEPKIAIAIDHAVPQSMCQSIVSQVTRRFPETEIELLGADGSLGRELLEAGHAHAAVMLDTVLHQSSVQFEWKTIKEIEFADVCTISASFHGDTRPTLPRILLTSDNDHDECSHSPRCITVSNRLLQLALVLDGCGWGRLPLHYIEEHLDAGRLIQFAQAPEIPFHPSLSVARSKAEAGPVAEFLWSVLTDLK
ncbi:LysR family transcriptional regulator [Novosphingobium sp. PS1R-30]|uniref:LysR family transcriptional regulator n=1 Tax=Novosphingobium anseongense TaxID=3133436 RepID=A0ABU8S3F4_9SPHN